MKLARMSGKIPVVIGVIRNVKKTSYTQLHEDQMEEQMAIEVKAEVNVKSKSLHGFVVNDHADKYLKGLRCSMLPYKDQDWMENIPLYGILGYIKHQYEAEGVAR